MLTTSKSLTWPISFICALPWPCSIAALPLVDDAWGTPMGTEPGADLHLDSDIILDNLPLLVGRCD